MDEIKNTAFDKVADINITKEMKSSFLSYAMSVIVSRALPDVRDGLKPVHRRILFGMEELGVQPNSAYKKSARIVGDVMGKYHPHGDSAIYDAMVRMAQEFSYRYPLVNGHGNFGSIDGDGAAAMRYTEAKMTKLSAEMLMDIKKETIDFVDNYDGSEREPSVLPAKFPNLLVNGSTGIAVGMATNIPPHNLGEVIDGILAYIEDNTIDLDTLMEHIKGPDFPTGGTILGMSNLRQAYATGNGSIKVRAKAEISELSNHKSVITITEIPFQVNKTRLIEKIAELAKEKRIEGITDLRDESNRNGIKIVIELTKSTSAEVTLNNLYKFTPLQTSFGINMLALVDHKPEVLGLKEMIKHYVNHQIEVLIRKTRYDLEKAKARAHILEGLLIALNRIDDVIEVIKNAYDDAELQLIEQFELSNEQAKAILEMRLRRLSGLEREKIEFELKELVATIEDLEITLDSTEKQFDIVKADLIRIKESYGDQRRTEISLAIDLDLEDEDLIPVEDIMITITQSGYCKRMSMETYKTQNRGGKGMTGIKTHDDDAVEHILYTSTHDYLLFFTSHGRVYKMKGYKIPTFGRTSKGIPIVNLLQLNENEKLSSVSSIQDFGSEQYLFFVTKKGIVKRTPVSGYQNIRSNGIRAINLKDDDELLEVRLTEGNQDIILGASNGKAIRFNETNARSMGRVASGVKGINLAPGERVVGSALVDEAQREILIVTEHGYGKRTLIDEYRQQNRGGKGVKTLNVTEKNGDLVKLRSVCGDEDLIILTNKGHMIRVPIDQISITSRVTQGVRLMRLQENHCVANIAIVPKTPENALPQEDVIDDLEVTMTPVDSVIKENLKTSTESVPETTTITEDRENDTKEKDAKEDLFSLLDDE